MAPQAVTLPAERAIPRQASLAVALVTSVLGVLATVLDQMRGLISVTAMAALVLGYFVAGLVVERFAMRYPDGTGMTITLASYAVRVALLGVILWWAMATPAIIAQLSPGWLAAGAIGALLAWTGGLMFWHARARIPIYDRPYEAPQGWDDED